MTELASVFGGRLVVTFVSRDMQAVGDRRAWVAFAELAPACEVAAADVVGWEEYSRE